MLSAQSGACSFCYACSPGISIRSAFRAAWSRYGRNNPNMMSFCTLSENSCEISNISCRKALRFLIIFFKISICVSPAQQPVCPLGHAGCFFSFGVIRMVKKDTEFADVQIVLTDDGEYLGILTPDGIEACAFQIRFAYGRRVFSSLRTIQKRIDQMLKEQLDFDYPKGFAISVHEEDLALFMTQSCTVNDLNAYLERKRATVREEIDVWNRERSWDTNPVFSDDLKALNFVFDAGSGELGTDGGVNHTKFLETPTSVDGVRVKALAAYALAAYRELESLILSDSITAIPDFLCFGFIHLVSVQFSNNMECIPDGAFCKCKNLKNVIIPESIREIGRDAFYMDSSIQRLRLPDSVGKVGSCALVGVRRVVYNGMAPGYPWGASSVLAKVNY